MPYRPYATTEVDRNYAYKVAWAGAGCSVISVALYLLGIDGMLVAHVLAVVFYAGYTFRWLRDRVDANDDDL